MENLPRAVVIDDDIESLSLLRQILVGHFESICAQDGNEGLKLVEQHRPDIILLDVRMPGGDGFSVFERLQEFPSMRGIPVVMVTAYPGTEDRIRSYELGVEDYIQQPCAAREIIARLKARMKKPKLAAVAGSRILRVGNLTLNEDTHDVRVNNRPIFLSPREYELLKFFAQRPEVIVPRQDLLTAVWSGVQVSLRNPDSQITNLRKKLRVFNYGIFALKGQGYILRPKGQAD